MSRPYLWLLAAAVIFFVAAQPFLFLNKTVFWVLLGATQVCGMCSFGFSMWTIAHER